MDRKKKCSTCRYFFNLECRVRSVVPWPIRDYADWCGEWDLSPEFLEDKIRFEAIDHSGNVVDQATLILSPQIEKSFSIGLHTSKVTIRVAFYSQEKKAWTELEIGKA